MWNRIYCQYFTKLIVSNFKSQRALDFQSCFILSSQVPLQIIRTCFPLLRDLSSGLQVLFHVEDQLKRIAPSTILKAPRMTKTEFFFGGGGGGGGGSL